MLDVSRHRLPKLKYHGKINPCLSSRLSSTKHTSTKTYLRMFRPHEHYAGSHSHLYNTLILSLLIFVHPLSALTPISSVLFMYAHLFIRILLVVLVRVNNSLFGWGRSSLCDLKHLYLRLDPEVLLWCCCCYKPWPLEGNITPLFRSQGRILMYI